MKDLDVLNETLTKAKVMALATSINEAPNVRIVNFVYEKQSPDKVYFTSSKDNQKVFEFEKNNKVAFTTVPVNTDEAVHVRCNDCIVSKSDKTIDDVKDLFVAKVPSYAEALEFIGADLIVFEVQMKKATVIVDFDNVVEIEF